MKWRKHEYQFWLLMVSGVSTGPVILTLLQIHCMTTSVCSNEQQQCPHADLTACATLEVPSLTVTMSWLSDGLKKHLLRECLTRYDCSYKRWLWNNDRSRCLLRQCRNIAQSDVCKIGGHWRGGEKLRDLKIYGKGACGWIENWQLGR